MVNTIRDAQDKPRDPRRRVLYNFDEEQRQLVLMAIGRLAIDRPGMNAALGDIAEALDGLQMFLDFKRLRALELE